MCSKFDPLRVSLLSALFRAACPGPSSSASRLLSELVWSFRFSRKLAGRIYYCSVDLWEMDRRTELEAVCFCIELDINFDFMLMSAAFFLRWIASSLATRFLSLIPLTSAYSLTSPCRLRKIWALASSSMTPLSAPALFFCIRRACYWSWF